MDDIAIALKNVSKCFRRYARPVDRLAEIWIPGTSKADEFWALRDISLEVRRGQTLGIIGRNGSGKSTLLQIIVKTLAPTAGEIYVNGRVAALLELGSGFNPEFTGRQNVYFNGQLLGLSKEEIAAKFDEIVTFADIGSFINQPVKTYSSGMFVRLAFAVVTIVEPDILVVDEALAVGDEAFQRKCFARIKSIQARGGTILFVSHSANSIVELCDTAILIDNGNLLLSGSPKLVISKYHKLIYAPANKLEGLYNEIRALHTHNHKNRLTNNGNTNNNGLQKSDLKIEEYYDPAMIPQSTIHYVSQGVKIEKPHLQTFDKKVVNVIIKCKEYIYTYAVRFLETAYQVRFGMMIKTVSGFELGGAASHPLNDGIECVEKGTVVEVEFKFRCLLQPGVYFLNAGVVGNIEGVETYLDRHIDVAMFRVQPEKDLLETAIIDFCIEANVSFDKTNSEEHSLSNDIYVYDVQKLIR